MRSNFLNVSFLQNYYLISITNRTKTMSYNNNGPSPVKIRQILYY